MHPRFPEHCPSELDSAAHLTCCEAGVIMGVPYSSENRWKYGSWTLNESLGVAGNKRPRTVDFRTTRDLCPAVNRFN
ncbi:jg20213 [Pararge aegeria aegeria]|uniref:Jg20213 protein n=1 Tax=Pararge aegeria aegeria TaxID=348720 RepID=A0A8S4R8A2_9NEOP|nr:jg20213 [Pararge aegeria aegeria]